MNEIIQSIALQLVDLEGVLAKSRSPGLLNDQSDLLTERLMAHPVLSPLPDVMLAHVSAVDNDKRFRVAERLIAAYHLAINDEKNAKFKRNGEDLWSLLIRNELPALMNAIDKRDPKELANFLMNFGSSYSWFGGITTSVDGYNKNLDEKHVALTYLDKLVCLGEYLGLLRCENPEAGPWGSNLYLNVNELINDIEELLKISIAPPLEIIHTDGLKTNNGVFHYRHINALYGAIRIKSLNIAKDPICEFGGGLGITALYSRRLGMKEYTLLDLPITCLLAGHYLLHAIDEESVCLYGEQAKQDAINILPFWEFDNFRDKSFGLSVNQDSFPEIADNLIINYLDKIKSITRNYFLSINHETFYPKTVNQFVSRYSSYEQIYRSKCWVREGYVEELWRV